MQIVTRAQWGAAPPKSTPTRVDPGRRVATCWHYDDSTPVRTPDHSGCAEQIRAIQKFHQGPERDWNDIGYNFLVCQHGYAFEGRGWDVLGAHAGPAGNAPSIGIQFRVGGDQQPSDPAKRAAVELHREAERRFGRPLQMKVHQDYVPTSCPGDVVKAWVRAGMPLAGTPTPQLPRIEEPRMEVVGAIGDYWRARGGPSSPLGQPKRPEVKTETGAYTEFDGGYVLWSPKTGAHESRGEIRKAAARVNYENGILGYPTSDEIRTPGGDGIFQSYERGMIYNSRHGTFIVRGAILSLWATLGYERSNLGYPTSDEFEGRKPGRVQRFAGGNIMHSNLGTWPVVGSMLARYAKDDYENGRWGYPGGGEIFKGDRWFQGFAGGIMSVPESVPPPNPGPTSRYVRPIAYRPDTQITQYWNVYSSRYRSKFHNGTDIAAPHGEPILATIGGTVLSYRDEPGYGRRIRIKGDDGLYWAYNHTSALTVRVGDRVKTGQEIGRVGATGNVTGPHLCLECYPGPAMTYDSDLNSNRWP